MRAWPTGVLVAVLAGFVVPLSARQQVPVQTPVEVPPQIGSIVLTLEQSRRLFDEFEYDEAIPLFDQLIAALMSGSRIEDPEMLVDVYQMRARANFALGETDAAEQDFAALLRVRPEFRLAEGVSPRVVAILDAVRTATVGQVLLTLMPAGDIEIDRRSYTVPPEGLVVDVTAGDHQVRAVRTNYAPITQTVTVTAGEARDLQLVMVRIAASLEVNTVQEGVEVLIDGASRGTTSSQGAGAATLVVDELSLGTHDLRLIRDCYVDVVRTVTLRADDLRTDPIQLERAIASVEVGTAAPGAAILIDGDLFGQTPGRLELCEGPHVIDVRGPSGRFVDRRDWHTGDDEILDVTLRSAFPIVSVTGPGAAATLTQLRADVERVLEPASDVLVYVPVESELEAAMQAENVPSDWLAGAVADSSSAMSSEVIREIGRRLAARLGVQGFVAVVAGDERFSASVGFLAAGSGLPESLQLGTADPASQRAVLDRLDAPLPMMVQPSLDSAVVDVSGLPGAVVVRPGGTGAAAGLISGDTIVGAAGRVVGSVADLRSVLADLGGGSLELEVQGYDGLTRPVSVSPSSAARLLPLRDGTLLYNRAMLALQDRAQTAVSPAERTAAHVNLAIVLLRLHSWDEALQSLGQVGIQDGSGVSAGTIAYLRGLALEGAGRVGEAQAAFGEAADAGDARLGRDGPLVAPLARQKLGGRIPSPTM